MNKFVGTKEENAIKKALDNMKSRFIFSNINGQLVIHVVFHFHSCTRKRTISLMKSWKKGSVTTIITGDYSVNPAAVGAHGRCNMLTNSN